MQLLHSAANPLSRIAAGYYGVNAVVLGASGFIGRWIARALCEQGANVTVVVRDRKSSEAIFHQYGIRAKLFQADLESDALPDLLAPLRPSIVFNLAGYGVDHTEQDQMASFRVNVKLIESICEAFPKKSTDDWTGQQLVHVGSALEYGTIGGDLAESSIPNPTTFYGKAKLAGTCWLQRHCQMTGMKAVTARLFTVYGPGEHRGKLLPVLLEGARNGRPIPLTSGLQELDFTYVEDAVAGLLHLGLASVKPGEVVNIATGLLTSVRSFVLTASSLLGIKQENLGFDVIESRFREMEHRPVNIERLRALVNWHPQTTIDEGIRKTLTFLSAQSKLRELQMR